MDSPFPSSPSWLPRDASPASSGAPDLLVAGNYCHDLLLRRSGEQAHTLGGSSSYISAVLEAEGVDYAVSAVVGEDFLYAHRLKHAARTVAGAKTTLFKADFTRGERILTLDAEAPPLLPSDIFTDARVALACGVMGELLPETLVRLSERSGKLLGDLQGFIRRCDPDGRIAHRRLEDTPYAAHLERIHILKASVEEARSLDVDAVRRRTCLVITRGAKGCTVLTAKETLEIPAFKVEERDPTGAGDCFLAGFALGVLRGMPLALCAELASWFGAQAVTQVGVPKLDLSALPTRLRLDSRRSAWG